VRTVKAKDGRW